MFQQYFVLISGFLSCLLAQLIKPFIYYLIHNEWQPRLFYQNGAMPSSHAALVVSVAFSIGYTEGTASPIFALALAVCCVVCYDACNVRYYAGKNIDLTQTLINELKELSLLKFDDPIYHKKMKTVLGHTYFEVLGGIIFGALFTVMLYNLVF